MRTPALILLCALSSPVRAEYALNVINLVESARGSALGGTLAGITGDGSLAWNSPLSCLDPGRPSVTLAGQRGFIEDNTWQVLGSIPLGAGRGVTAGIAYYDAGTVPAGSDPSRRVNAQQDFMGLVSGGVALTSWTSVAFTVKAIRTELVDEFTSSSVAFDAGLHVRYREGIEFGVLVNNAGEDISYRGNRIPLGTLVRAGAAVTVEVAQGDGAGANEIAVLADAVYPIEERVTDLRLGAEYRWRGLVTLRGGAATRERNVDTGRLVDSGRLRYSAGLGIRVGAYRLDYGASLFGASGLPQVLSLTIEF